MKNFENFEAFKMSKTQMNEITGGYRRKSVKYGERLNNPVGFTVDRYSLTFNKVK